MDSNRNGKNYGRNRITTNDIPHINHARHSSSYGALLSSISLMAIFSILHFVGKLEFLIETRETTYLVGNASATYAAIAIPAFSDGNTHVIRNTTADITSIQEGSSGGNATFDDVSFRDLIRDTTQNNSMNLDTYHNQTGKSITKKLEVAWLMSFPNSGTTYTNHLLQDYTRTTTATNYGQEQSTKHASIAIDPSSIDGPFFRYPSWSLPPRYILTKTHCGGECDACQDPSDGKHYSYSTLEAFDTACRKIGRAHV